MVVLKVRGFSQFESAFFFAWVFFPKRRTNCLLRPFPGLLRAMGRRPALSDRPICCTFKPAGLGTFNAVADRRS
jgi:hypothetical protein